MMLMKIGRGCLAETEADSEKVLYTVHPELVVADDYEGHHAAVFFAS